MSTIAYEADAAQRLALEAAPDAALALIGPPGSGKTFTLVRRALALARNTDRRVLLSAASGRAVARLRDELAALVPAGDAQSIPLCATLGDAAVEILRSQGREPRRIDDVGASHVFEEVGASLFDLAWTEFVGSEIDPEITGLRTPQRFSAAAYRLIRRLRRAQISPAQFERLCFQGATAFYAHPPNFAGPDLLMETRPKYRDSLRVTGDDLQAQYARELDLVKILVKLYESYVDSLVKRGCLTDTDAIFEAVDVLRSAEGKKLISYRYACIDDAQDLTEGEIAFVEALFGDRRVGVTLAGDPAQATRLFAGARGDAELERTNEIVRFEGTYRTPPQLLAVARRVLDPKSAVTQSGARSHPERRRVAPESKGSEVEGHVEFHRAPTQDDEARFVAAAVTAALRDGVAPSRIAVVVRHLGCAQPYIDGLLARNVPVDVSGAGSLFDFRVVEDALAALWALANPFRNDMLLRNLEAPWLNLSDATIAALCAAPEEPQAALFELPDDEVEGTRPRSDRSRELRLGRNVLCGDVDSELPEDARGRLAAFRNSLERWERFEAEIELPALARTIVGETVLAVLGDDARGRFERSLIVRLIEMLDDFCAREPLATLADFLTYTDDVAGADADLLKLERRDAEAVSVLDVEAAKGLDFDRVFVVDVRAGAFPRYYVPGAFLFTPKLGMIPKENVGSEARAARTAKFTYALHRLKLREKYNEQERRAFYCAATRARERLYVSASGKPTRGFGTPEIFEELRDG